MSDLIATYEPDELIREALRQMGLPIESQHFEDTPTRFLKYLAAYLRPVDLQEVLSDGFADEDETKAFSRTLVVQAPIPFMGVCAHHLLPFFGSAAVGYLPGDRVVGLSKLTRLVYAAGHLAPSTQEQITNLVADALMGSDTIKPQGVAVLTSALHGCMSARGVESPDTRTLATAIRGVFTDKPTLEDRFTAIALRSIPA